MISMRRASSKLVMRAFFFAPLLLPFCLDDDLAWGWGRFLYVFRRCIFLSGLSRVFGWERERLSAEVSYKHQVYAVAQIAFC